MYWFTDRFCQFGLLWLICDMENHGQIMHVKQATIFTTTITKLATTLK